jgi:AcrR family transcriptional regulator
MSRNVERGLVTRQSLIATATGLFTKVGYDATSIEAVLRESGVSRGALYHHFDSKEQLFEAVLEALEAELAQATVAAAQGVADPAKALQLGCGTFLDLAQTPKVRREIDARHGFGLLKAVLASAADNGRVRRELVDTFAHMLLAALFEVALMVSRAENTEATLRSGRAALGELIDRLLAD